MRSFARSSRVAVVLMTLFGWTSLLVADPPAVSHSHELDATPVSFRKADLDLRTHPIDPALRLAEESLRHVRANVNDYTALFAKRCRVDGNLPPLQFAHLKIKNRKVDSGQMLAPMSVYLDYLKPSSVKGREVIWVENENEGKIVVHQGGLAGLLTLHLDPEGSLAMRGQRYSIRSIGIENLLEQIIGVAKEDRLHGECFVEIDPAAQLGNHQCTRVTITHPEPRDHFRFHQAVVLFDNDLNIPIRYCAWTWPTTPGGKPVLDEEYNYLRVEVNTGLSAIDFDPANPDYRYAD
ncbi:DUF1571 domain-containing protein [Rhodopirellula sp. MGV]|uniref:DUF1571 domain-containing protein n=1 Tax=Rhodopirellula sp. MGV TaxID=2023130 RepID=UPI000B962C74|nr:DUF1571 domain-containing protein [Rhodopirellula sp. MGV]OYP36407.1 hypothetical protein CGZ80_08865 [Rhodopirellula sp. MGV]PNY36834.1 DUF1571 domain-containing protein [Rhodopirellula baltica]